jgi:hypothetical protein
VSLERPPTALEPSRDADLSASLFAATRTAAVYMASTTYPRTSFASSSTSSSRPSLPNRLPIDASECSSSFRPLDVFALADAPPSFRRNVEECLILRDVFDKLGPGMRMESPTYEELFEIVEAGSAQLSQWDKKWVDMMGESRFERSDRTVADLLPFCRGRNVRFSSFARASLRPLTFFASQAMGRLSRAQDSRTAPPRSYVPAHVHLPRHGRRRSREDLPQDARVCPHGHRVCVGHPTLGC